MGVGCVESGPALGVWSPTQVGTRRGTGLWLGGESASLGHRSPVHRFWRGGVGFLPVKLTVSEYLGSQAATGMCAAWDRVCCQGSGPRHRWELEGMQIRESASQGRRGLGTPSLSDFQPQWLGGEC